MKTKHTKGPWQIYHHAHRTNAGGLLSVGQEDGVQMLEAGGVYENHFTVSTGSRSHDNVKSNIQGSWIGYHVCELKYPPNGKERGFAEAKANAKLIAAAPEMLEALQMIVGNENIKKEFEHFMQFTLAKQAIKKALGE